MHEAKLDGWRFCVEVTDGRLRLWSRGGHDWAPKLPELEGLAEFGDVVLDGEIIVATPDGRADFELLTSRLNRRPGDPPPGQPVSLYVFDVLATGGMTSRPAMERAPSHSRRTRARRAHRVARPTASSDGTAMHEATAAIGAEGTVSKAVRSVYRAGRSRFWLKAKHSTTETFQVAGWRPSTSSRPGGLILAENDYPDRRSHARYRRQRPTGPRRPAAPLRPATPYRHRHHPRRLPHRHRPLYLPHTHPRPSPRSVRHSGPTSRAGAPVRYQDWLARTATMTNMTHRGCGVPPRPRSTILGCSAK